MTTILALDSGAFSAHTQNKSIDIGSYIEYIKRNEKQLEVYFNLDVLGDCSKSYTNWIHMRSQGLCPVPVFHITEEPRDLRFLERYLKMTDYIAIGAIANMSTNKRMESLDRFWEEHLTDSDGMPIAKVHGFGLTSIRVMKKYPWYSVDSTSWVMFGRYGAILVPKYSNGKYVYNENPFIVTVSSRSPNMKTRGKHFYTCSKEIQRTIIDYVHHMGFSIGGSITNWDTEDGRPEEEIVEYGVTNVHLQRDMINMLYFLGVQESLPEWPWAFKTEERVPTI